MTSADTRWATSPLTFATVLGSLVVLAAIGSWVASGGGYFWPRWVILGVAVALAPAVLWHQLRGRENTALTRLWWHVDVSAIAASCVVLVWAFTGAHGVWVLWPVFSFALALGVHALIEFRSELLPLRAQQLQQRVDTLSRTRRQAVDAQAAQLRRIERDLHDGAQARLVALTMQLGRAEVELVHEPAAAALVRAARQEATVAIQELRALSRGIAPPVLADRGLVAAAQSLADRAHAELKVIAADGSERLPPALENAAYFVVAEALANAAKHAPGAAVCVALALHRHALLVDVTDDGPGGADPTGSGLRGLRARVEALDGTLDLVSPEGGPTRLHAELPCG